jgi:hypothetical protein
MSRRIHSIAAALLVGAVVLGTSVRVVAPNFPPYVGTPAYRAEKSLVLPATPIFRLENSDGDVLVRTAIPGTESEAIRVIAEVRGYRSGAATLETLAQTAEGLFSTLQQGDETVLVVDTSSAPPGADFIVNHRIVVPAGTHIEIAGGNGNIRVFPGCGSVEARAVNADIKIERPSGPLLAETVNGRIHVRDVVAGAQMVTVNGDIRAEVGAGPVYGSTTNGAVRARLLGPDVGSASFKAVHGPVAIDLPERLGFSLSAIAPPGRVSGVDTSGGRDGTYTATEGDGATALTLETQSGTISVRRHP